MKLFNNRALPWSGEGARLVALVAFSVILFALIWDRTSPSSWGVPINYSGDAIQILTWIKAAAEGDYYPVWLIHVDRLGAPFEANWNDFPMYEKTLTMMLGLAARIFGVFLAGNLAALSANVTAILSFYLVSRYLRHRWEWSFVGAILFGFAYYHTWRGLHHLLLAFTFTLPLALLCVAMIAKSSRLNARNGMGVFCLAIAVVMGISNPYNLNIYLQFVCFAMLAQFLSRRRKENLIVGGLSIAVSCAAFLLVNAGTFIHRWREGPNPDGIIRAYYEAEQFGLKLVECFTPPPGHNIGALAAIGERYESLSKIPGETFSAYLGVVVLCGLVWIAVEAVQRTASRRAGRPSGQALQVAWIYIYSAIGGFNCVLAFGGFQLFRATNRFSIVISAVTLLFLASRLSRIGLRWPKKNVQLAAGALLLLGVIDQAPLGSRADEREAFAAAMEDDRRFVEAMESKLGEGAMIFELPVLGFPESKRVDGLPHYELLRPYLHSQDLRFSHGFNKGTPRQSWQRHMELASPDEMVKTLESFGFSAILLHRKAYADRGESLLGFLRQLDRTEVIEDAAGERICVLLHPLESPRLPTPAEFPVVEFVGGFSRWDKTATTSRFWTAGDARLKFRAVDPEPGEHLFTCHLATLRDRVVTLRFGDAVLWRGEVAKDSLTGIQVRFRPVNGQNLLELNAGLETSGPVNVDGSPLSLGLINPRIAPVDSSGSR